ESPRVEGGAAGARRARGTPRRSRGMRRPRGRGAPTRAWRVRRPSEGDAGARRRRRPRGGRRRRASRASAREKRVRAALASRPRREEGSPSESTGSDLSFEVPPDREAVRVLVLELLVVAVEVMRGLGENEAVVRRGAPVLKVLDDRRRLGVGSLVPHREADVG